MKSATPTSKVFFMLTSLVSLSACSMKAPPAITEAGAQKQTAPQATANADSHQSPPAAPSKDQASPKMSATTQDAFLFTPSGKIAQNLYAVMNIQAENGSKKGLHYECSETQCTLNFSNEGVAIALLKPGTPSSEGTQEITAEENVTSEDQDLNLQVPNSYGRLSIRGDAAKLAFDALQVNPLKVAEGSIFYPGMRKKGAQVECYQTQKDTQNQSYQCTIHLEWKTGSISPVLN